MRAPDDWDAAIDWLAVQDLRVPDDCLHEAEFRETDFLEAEALAAPEEALAARGAPVPVPASWEVPVAEVPVEPAGAWVEAQVEPAVARVAGERPVPLDGSDESDE